MTGRFAPTPSGRMHIGNITAMLAAWLDARAGGSWNGTDGTNGNGRILLRIEDIDTPRVLPDADRWIMDDLTWLGLDWDDEPVYQSRRLDIYEEALAALRDCRPALIYPCFCSRADIRAASAPQEGDGFQIYPGTCRRLMQNHPETVAARLAHGDRHSLRIAMTEADRGAADSTVSFVDEVFGPQTYDLAREIGDSVIRRSDGLFAYQFVVTVDDLLMGVDSIVRGRDLLRSTALQIYIRECLAKAPAHMRYTHIPLIDNAAGRRLAKRERSLDMGALRARGVGAEEVIGCCAWLLRLIDRPEPCAAADLLPLFAEHGWDELRKDHSDRALKPDDPAMPRWLVEALGE
ncbi:glutamyl-Q tRNA(Asp) ligase [Bifidobacterium sp. UTCIF-37]|uniref:glutamyl-Q tRNA(Asp) synthetase n=1 Tax=unclassified Bifidobacterium TaxID=2608897 RepID=UPI001127373F|nr:MULTISPECIES: glutamyl-Q tRNA(Asp) synthetase [unclassified Bifidobacterium]TPF86969.1 glutamyl-Q tRNA(Asp) ligase [Bifidobacterium sp. UTCIF-37]TPF90800.1 glutamyl-Q tRNA(Asp) ligase [Bifidobacterium sp. UTCIF-38]